ncbi:hypothetical protein PN471_06150 [Aphanizomenon sp. CS-733/32]|uniref:hypothetical protein n=1 Tax=Aphanizomenon sp. CS-733/32 TaxID=3021715 RepID=UPI00232C5E44|nr:hypothetical protein [Aphanizomenon sp. CS-733/32]MDB9308229.1 hypothetical protein [Aphanizomenon sp. CS-733/32]
MTDKILLPSAWDNLKDEHKQLAQELTQSILRGEASLQLLLQLLTGEEIDDEFHATVKKIGNHKFDVEVTTPDKPQTSSPTLTLATFTAPSNLEFSDIIVAALKRQCDNICRRPGQAEACQKCREIFG